MQEFGIFFFLCGASACAARAGSNLNFFRAERAQREALREAESNLNFFFA